MANEIREAELVVIRLVESNELTAGMYVRVRADDLILGRQEPTGPNNHMGPDDRVKFTHRGANIYGVSVRRHTGRWEKTPFSGPLEDMFAIVCTFMQHLVAAYP
jgi:hypothetical protein